MTMETQDFGRSMKTASDIGDDDSSGLVAGDLLGDLIGEEKLEQYIADVAALVRESTMQSIESITPWFFNNMPKIYYQTTPRAEKVQHLQAIMSTRLFDTKQVVSHWDTEGHKVTYMGPGIDAELLHDVTNRASTMQTKMGSIYFSRDDRLFIAAFNQAPHKNADLSNPRISEKLRMAREIILAEFGAEKDAVDSYINQLDHEFIVNATPARIHLTYRMVRYMKSHEGAHTFFEPVADRPTARITLGIKNATVGEVLEQSVNLFARYGVKLTRCFTVTFKQNLDAEISILHFHVASIKDEKINVESVPMLKLNKALRTMGWVDKDEYSAFMGPQYLFSMNAVNLIRSLAAWAQVMLTKENAYYFSQEKVRSTLFKYPQILKELIAFFRDKFDPAIDSSLESNNHRSNRNIDQHLAQLDKLMLPLTDEVEKSILTSAVRFIQHVQKTNYFHQVKTGLAFRISPEVLDAKFYPEKPYCIFFIVGRNYRMFHVRWKDIARGGLRVVMPRTVVDHEVAFAGIFDEVYGLSHAQQLKNKDIPEGGAKGVLLLKPGGDRIAAVRGGVNALLDLLVREDESRDGKQEKMVSYFDRDDIIYLGPDENITNDLIEWIPAQAERRGYPYAAAFMSSKPGAGINHKEYGVTSEGLNVFVENMLRFLNIDPKQRDFTIKMTGGPDGDVAGNELKILHREYGERARVVAIGDGTGAAYDPAGLDWPELLRLFKASQGIASFNKQKLSASPLAFVVTADTPENMKIRNELHARIKADILIPGGGRPYTVNDKNWELFLVDGVPTVRAIVEGANIFFTENARKKLQEHGVLIIKDSSANKTGVICSSYEIIASLTLSEREFLDIKQIYVDQVIDILRHKADLEAKLLFKEYIRSGRSRTLVDLSKDISREINDVTDVLLQEITKRENEVETDSFYQNIVMTHCPKILVEKYRSRILEKLPTPHKVALIAAYMASNIVYREGLGWIERLPQDIRFSVCLSYMKNDQLRGEIMHAVESSSLDHKDKILAILKRSATRDLTILGLEGK